MKQPFIILLISFTFLLHADIGKIESASGDTHVERSGKKISAAKILKKNDTVITGKDGKMKIILKDDTKISVGKNSMLLIDDYLLRKESRDRGTKLLETITMRIEKISPERFNFKTKTATIGIRGVGISDNSTAGCTEKLTIDKKSKMVKIPNTEFGPLPLSVLVKTDTGKIVYRKNGIADMQRDFEIVSAVLKNNYRIMIANAFDEIEFCKTIERE